MKFVRMISDFPDGFTLNIPSIGEAETADFTEGQAIKYNSMDTGNFRSSLITISTLQMQSRRSSSEIATIAQM